mmetsp:Transcript_60024/g.177968  ORF Transcript_60024/g.177968 Transcript_60024/m.177968 type:complete len:82 (-) Transcript_60024:124-369(-)
MAILASDPTRPNCLLHFLAAKFCERDAMCTAGSSSSKQLGTRSNKQGGRKSNSTHLHLGETNALAVANHRKRRNVFKGAEQ